MAFEVRVPQLGESVTEAVVARWAKADGDRVAPDDVLLELETDKATVEIAAERQGVLRVRTDEGATVQVGDLLAVIEEAGAGAGDGNGARAAREARSAKAEARPAKVEARPAKVEARPERAESPPTKAEPAPAGDTATPGPLSPAVRRLVEEHDLDAAAIPATGKGGRLTKGDVLAYLGEEEEQKAEARPKEPEAPPPAPEKAREPEHPETPPAARPAAPAPPPAGEGPRDERVPMGRIRARIAERLVAAQHTAAILTTFNEIDMSAVTALRARYKDAFQEKYGTRLGFMSLFAAACCRALADVPVVNAEIQGEEIVYHRAVHLGIAVGTERGLVVPVVKDADRRSLAEIEHEIARLAERARTGKLAVDELTGGTFTISNGGVYGSLMSTPILNPPQSGILGMHKIEQRPVVVDGQIVARPMMYVALSYDHRLVDGEQAVTFLVRVKEQIEDPARLVLGV